MNKKNIPNITVGILSDNPIRFTLRGKYQYSHEGFIEGSWKAFADGNTIKLTSGENTLRLPEGTVLEPATDECSFTLHEVVIGVGFHWERKEDQVFGGALKLIIEEGKVTAINVLPLEDYLVSVISSEMSAASSPELLKAHAVISRSWLLAQIEKNKSLEQKGEDYQTVTETETEHLRWYDCEDHEHFDVCADDHCQRYQGITRASTPEVEKAIADTFGEVLTFDHKICDARFSKCCGGVTEVFENVWEPVHHPYLQKIIDNDSIPEGYDLELKNENAARSWILGNPEAFCNTNDKEVLAQILNDYDQETNDFYRWKVRYGQEELSELVKRRTGIDFGLIMELVPVERGESGRLIRLKIVGEKRTMTIGKELEIRKAFSGSHLYSSAFVIEKIHEKNGIFFILKGAGWGHGVGLCQIGAAVMGAKGYDYKAILNHYFKGAERERRY